MVGQARNTFPAPVGQGHPPPVPSARVSRTGDVAAALTHFLATVQGWQRSGSWALQWITLRAAVVLLLAGLGRDSDARTVLVAADSDADAPMVREADAARFAQVRAEVEGRLGATQARQVSDAARRTPRTEVVDRALAALSAAATAGRSAGVRSGQPAIT